MLGRLEDVPLTTKYEHQEKQTCAEFDDIFALAYQSGSIGYYFGDPKDHMSTPVSYTHLDVYKRQSLLTQMVMYRT